MTTNLRKDAILYPVITFAVTWICWGTLILFGLPAKSTWYSTTLYMLGGFTTAIVAFLLPLFRGKEARREYYGRFFRFRIPAMQYILAVIPAVIMYALSYLLVFLFNRSAASTLAIQPAYMILPLFVSMVFGGGIEEFGWRGIMVGNMKKLSPLWTALIVGCIWALWHLPLFFIQGVSQYQANFPAFFLQVLGYSFALTMIYQRTKSVVPCIIFHALVNALGGIGFLYGNDQIPAVWIDGLAKLAVGVATYFIVSLAASRAAPVQAQVQE